MPTPSDMPNTTPAQITEEAIRIIAGAPEYGPLQPVEYANALPPRAAALARVFSDKEIITAAERYRVADKSATRWRRFYGLLARSVLILALLSVVLGGA